MHVSPNDPTVRRMNDSSTYEPSTATLPPLPPRYGAVPVEPTAAAPSVPRPPAPLPPLRSPRRRVKGMVLVTALLSALLASGATLTGVWALGGFDTRSTAVPTVLGNIGAQNRPSGGGGSSGGAFLDSERIAREIRPGIVNIRVSGARGEGSGSGEIFTADGYIMTNSHVVEGSSTVKVELTDGRRLDGKVIGNDTETDIAVVKVDADDLPVVPLGNSMDVQIGEPVIAIGNPLGLQGGPTVTTGIVSALGREVDTENGKLFDMIQTDAAIAPGSSGGALLDANGTVIGITTAIAVSSAGAEGIGFATPIEVARNVAEQIIEKGKVTRALLGVIGDTVIDPNTGRDSGVKVTRVTPGSAAADAGIEPGDVIVDANGKPIQSFANLKVLIRALEPGDEISLTTERGGKRTVANITLGESN
jgi:putative serine protease PepD